MSVNGAPTGAPTGTGAPAGAPTGTGAPAGAPTGTGAPAGAPTGTGAPAGAPTGSDPPARTREQPAPAHPPEHPRAHRAPGTGAPTGTRQGPRRSQRNTGHVSDRSASGTAHIRSYRPAGGYRPSGEARSVARRRLHAGVAARYERGGSRVRAQRHGGCAQSSAGNHFDVEPIGDLHQRQLPYPRSSRTA